MMTARGWYIATAIYAVLTFVEEDWSPTFVILVVLCLATGSIIDTIKDNRK